MSDQNSKVRTEEIKDLFSTFCKKAYHNDPSTASDLNYLDKCIALWQLDYHCEVVKADDSVCKSYPLKMVIPIYELGARREVLESTSPINLNSINNVPDFLKEVKDHWRRGAIARHKNMAPLPVILCNKKYVCRSGTLSVTTDAPLPNPYEDISCMSKNLDETPQGRYFKAYTKLEKAQEVDSSLLKLLNISVILDFMIHSKKLQGWDSLSLSEKKDENKKYSDFKRASLPYPECEFFKKYFNNLLNSRFVFINWVDPIYDVELLVSNKESDPIPPKVTTQWAAYKYWDLQGMSKHYLKLALLYLMDEESKESGLLVHCISGWDSTPLMTSLIRLSLWADGLAHPSLSAKQMLFFTLAYDWYLFGHQLPDRLDRGEFILYFCFEFLDKIIDDSYSMNEKYERRKSAYIKLKERYNSLSKEESGISSDSNTPNQSSNILEQPLNFCEDHFELKSAIVPRGSSNPENQTVGVLRDSNVSKGKDSSGTKSKKKSVGDKPTDEFDNRKENKENVVSQNSKPVAVSDKARSRHGSSSSNDCGGWTVLSVPSQDYQIDNLSLDDFALMEDSTPSGSPESNESITVFSRRLRLLKIRSLFFKIFKDVYNPKNGPPKAAEYLNIALDKIFKSDQFMP